MLRASLLGVAAGEDGGLRCFHGFHFREEDAVDTVVEGLLQDPLVHFLGVGGYSDEGRGIGLQTALLVDAFSVEEELEGDLQLGEVHAHVLVFDEDEVVAGGGCVGDFVEVAVGDVGSEGGFSIFEELDEAVKSGFVGHGGRPAFAGLGGVVIIREAGAYGKGILGWMPLGYVRIGGLVMRGNLGVKRRRK